MIHMCSYVQVRPHGQPAECIKELLRLVKKFPDGFFMHTTAFFNAALRGAFAASAPAVAYARQLLHVRYNADRDECPDDDEAALKWGLLDDVKTMPGPKKRGDSNIRFKCTLTDQVRHETPSHQTPRPRGGHVVHHVFRASCLTHVSFLFLLPSQDQLRLGYCDGQGFLFRWRTKKTQQLLLHPPSPLG